MATATPSVPVDLGSVVSAADAQLASLVQQATADVVAPSPTPEPTPVVEPPSITPAPVAAPVETAQPATTEPTSVAPSVPTFDLSRLTVEQRKDYDDAVAKEGDPAKVFSRYWELNNRLARIARGEEPAPGTKPAPPPEPEPLAAPPQEVIAQEVQERLFTDPEVGQWRSEYAINKSSIGELLKVDPALPKREFEAAVSGAYNRNAFEISRLQANLNEPYVKENPDVEQGIRQALVNLKSDRMEIDRLRMSNERLDERFARKAQSYEQTVSQARRQEFESQQAAVRQQRDSEQFAERFDKAWPAHVTNVAKSNQIGDDIAPGFTRMATYEVLGMIRRDEVVDIEQLPQILDKLAKQYLGEIETAHRYKSRDYALKANANAEAPIIVPPNATVQDTNTRPLMSRQEVDAAHDALLRKTLGEAALR